MKRNWIEPFKVSEMLDQVDPNSAKMPPKASSVYLFSEKPWRGTPTKSCIPLYVGGNAVNPDRFRTRVGDVIADLFGFYAGHNLGHSSGGNGSTSIVTIAKLNR